MCLTRLWRLLLFSLRWRPLLLWRWPLLTLMLLMHAISSRWLVRLSTLAIVLGIILSPSLGISISSLFTYGSTSTQLCWVVHFEMFYSSYSNELRRHLLTRITRCLVPLWVSIAPALRRIIMRSWARRLLLTEKR